jgi:hypothetical protein
MIASSSVAFRRPAISSSLERSCSNTFTRGTAFLKCRECRGQYHRCGNRGVAEVQLGIFATSQSTHLFHQFIGVFQQLADFLPGKVFLPP